MDYLEECIDKFKVPVTKTKKIKITDLLEDGVYNHDSVNYQQIDDILQAILNFKAEAIELFSEENDMESSVAHQTYNQMKEQLINYINVEVAPNSATLFSLLRKLELKEYQSIRGYLVTILFNIKNDEAFNLIKRSQTPVEMIEPTNGPADLVLYEKKFAKNLQKSA